MTFPVVLGALGSTLVACGVVVQALQKPRRFGAADRALRPRYGPLDVIPPVLGLAIAGPAGVVIACGAVVGARRFFRLQRAARSRARLLAQLPDAVAGIASSLRAGLSLPAAISSVGADSEQPVSGALRDVSRTLESGASLEKALAALADGPEPSRRLVVGILRMHRYLGPGLPAALDSVVSVLRERLAAEDEIRALTAQARLSGWVVGLLPLGFLGVLALASPQDLGAAYASPVGIVAMGVGLVLQLAGFLWIRSLLRVEP